MKRLLAVAASLFLTSPAAYAEYPNVKVGVLTDMSGFLSEGTGPGSAAAAELAAEDARKLYPDIKIQGISADHQNKADIGSATARRWFEVENVDAIADLTNSAVGIAVQDIGRTLGKLTISTVGTSLLTEKYCSPTGIQWTMDTYTYSKAVTAGVMKTGGDSWYFITVDYAGGHGLEESMSSFVKAGGGKVLGAVRHPSGASDFSSFLLQAQSSKAKVIGLANAGGDTINTIKQAQEFGIVKGGQLLAVPTFFLTDIHALGLQTAQGVRFASPFYWDQTDDTRAWSKRFFDRMKKMPTHPQAGVYTALMHYFKAVNATKSTDAKIVIAKMRELPIQDFMTKSGKLRENGSVVRERLLLEVKAPAESKYPWDYAKIVQAMSPEDAAPKPLEQTGCNLVTN
jgi:branched-chain amino acid transport system substrate-binding protein